MYVDIFGQMFQAIMPNIGLAALLLTSCIIVLAVNRDAFELEPNPSVAITPLGGTVQYRPYRYSCENGHKCRQLMLVFVTGFRVLIGAMLGAAVVSFFVNGVLNALATDPFPATWFHQAGVWWVANVNILSKVGQLVQAAAVLAGPLIVFALANMVYLIIRARAEAR